ncbi:class I SAM-dependent methyltransferase [uncultured Thiodictyon sp.]|uniref:class I SAM-dependent methyltransferase n=1 Tax=uncultured Thiodictyon sp. TaxID=1846217 RepID=UPI0025EFF5DF|nr:class I SAM-dependent methyltransferase [uncultured Thiodictyon sp.]
MTKEFQCSACDGVRVGRIFEVPEQYFGWSEVFSYDQCEQCGTIAIRQVPTQLGSYYGPAYYSMKMSEVQAEGGHARVLRRLRTDYWLRFGGGVQRLGSEAMSRLVGRAEVIERFGKWMRMAQVRSHSIIADIGCGQGSYLWALYREGMDHVFGYDPFVERPGKIGKHGYIANTGVDALPTNIDFMLMNHSLEHALEPGQLLRDCHRQLAGTGYLLIQMPVADNPMLERYAIHWVGLDAPRHINVFSEAGARRLLERSGFNVVASERYTHIFQWVMSEQLRRGVAQAAHDSYLNDSGTPLFSQADMNDLVRQTQAMTASRDGDCITILARK